MRTVASPAFNSRMRATVLLAFLFGATAVAAIPGDTTAVTFSVVPKLEGFYSPARGLGVGFDYTLRNIGYEGSELKIEQVTMTRHGEYHGFFFSADPYTAGFFWGLGISYVGTRAFTFYGLGPGSHPDDGVGLSLRRVAAEARAGWYPDPLLLVQPVVRIVHGDLREIRDDIPELLDASSVANLLRASEASSLGLEYGLDLVVEHFDNPAFPHRGASLNLAGRRYDGLGSDPFAYWSGIAIAHGALPIRGERTILQGRALMRLTRETSARGAPFYALPTVDSELVGGYARFRMVGRDLLALSAGVRFPVLDVLNFVGAEAFVAVHAANAYNDLFSEFEPAISFAREPERGVESAPLRPALTLGGHIVNLSRRSTILSGQLGVSPEGWQLAGLSFTVDLRQRRPYVR